MKKLVAFLICLIMVVSLFSCRTNDQKEKEAVTTNGQENGETTVTTDDAPPSSNSSHDVAMLAYEAATTGEICVFDERLGEVKLEDCRFPSNDLRLGECEILNKAILDMDGDGINEYVIQSETKDHIVLHYYNGKVYSYCFDSSNFYNLNTDGSFYWIDSYELSNCTRGYSQIVFEVSSFCTKEIYRIKQTSPYDYGENNHEYFVDGKQITREEFRNYYDSNCRSKTIATFSPLDISCEYPISSEKAYELASEFWGLKSGTKDGAAGTVYVLKIVILEKPNSDTQGYRIGCQWEGYTNHVIDIFYAQPPKSVRIYEEVIVDAITGEVREYDSITSQPSKNEIAMEMYEAVLKNEIKVYEVNGPKLEETRYLKDCSRPFDMIPLCELESLRYVYIDLDNNGTNELVIDCYGDTLILRYFEGVVYLYPFTFREISKLHTDGDPNAEYDIGSKQLTREEMLKYFKDNSKSKSEYSQLEVSWLNKISRSDAVLLAQEYWARFYPTETEKGDIIVPSYNSCAPSSVYVVTMQRFVLDHWSTINEIWIDKNTGEAIIPYAPDGER